jgi:hypothetical protein
MKSTVTSEQLLCMLAREFRGTRDQQKRAAIAAEYAKLVKRLIKSKSWEEIPPLEDQLPDEWMPDAFFTHWSLRPPIRRTAQPAIITEGKQDVTILAALLPAEVQHACELESAGGLPNLGPQARERLSKHHAPIVIVFDTNTLEDAVIAEMLRDMKDQVAPAALGIPYDVVCCIPRIEKVFFESAIDLQRIFPYFKAVFVKGIARTNPKQQLEALFKEGGGPGTLSAFLAKLKPDEVEKLQAMDPIRRVVVFITNNLAPVQSK